MKNGVTYLSFFSFVFAFDVFLKKLLNLSLFCLLIVLFSIACALFLGSIALWMELSSYSWFDGVFYVVLVSFYFVVFG